MDRDPFSAKQTMLVCVLTVAAAVLLVVFGQGPR